MKKFLIVTLILMLFCIFSPTNVCFAEDIQSKLDDKLDSMLDKIDFGDLDDFANQNLSDEFNFKCIKDYLKGIIKGDFKFGISDVLKLSQKILSKHILEFLPLSITIITISILLSIISGLSSNFKKKSTSEIVYFVCFIAIIVAVISSLLIVVKDTIKVIRNMHKFMTIIFPILLTLMSALGGVVTVSAYQPLMASLTYIVSFIVTKIIMPIFIGTMIFSIVGNLSSNIKLDKITSSLKSVGEFVLGLIFSLFTTFVTLEGITGSSIDNVSIKSAKFAISSYVPILGGYLSDGFDLALASGVLIKNSLGFVGIITILLLTIAPVIKIAIFVLTLKITAGIVEPISDSRISSFVFTVSKNMTLLIALLLGVAFMFFIITMLVILSLNAVV